MWEQKLAGQVRAIKTNGWLSGLKIEELRREIENPEPYEEIEEQMQEDIECEIVRNEENARGSILGRMGESGADEHKIKIIDMLLQEIKSGDNSKPPNVRSIDRRKVKEFTRKVDEVAQYFLVSSL